MERGTCWGLSYIHYSYQSLILNVLDLYSFIVIYCNYEKEESYSSFSTGSASALPCFCVFPAIATEHPLCRFDEEPGIGPRYSDISETARSSLPYHIYKEHVLCQLKQTRFS